MSLDLLPLILAAIFCVGKQMKTSHSIWIFPSLLAMRDFNGKVGN